MEFTLKEGGRGRRKQQISEFHGLFLPENTVSSVLFPKPLMLSSILVSNIMIITSSLLQHKMKDSLEVEKRLITGSSETSFISEHEGLRWNHHSLHTFQFLVQFLE